MKRFCAPLACTNLNANTMTHAQREILGSLLFLLLLAFAVVAMLAM